MKIIMAFLLTVTGMEVALARATTNREIRMITQQAYYRNFYQTALHVSMKVFETKESLENKLSHGLKIRHNRMYRLRNVFESGTRNEEDGLNWQLNVLRSFLHRIKLAKRVELKIKSENLLIDLTMIQLRLESLKHSLHYFMRSFNINISKTTTQINSEANNRLETLTTLKDLQRFLVLIMRDFGTKQSRN